MRWNPTRRWWLALALVGASVVVLLLALWERERSPEPVLSRRGPIVDRSGRTLAEDVPGAVVWIDGDQVGDLKSTVYLVCTALACDEQRRVELARAKVEGRRYRVVRWNATKDDVARIAAHNTRGVHTTPRSVRVYPFGDVGASVIGHVGDEHRGLAGVEYAMQDVLREGSHADGATVRLSLDIELQARLEAWQARLAENTSAAGITALVLSASTGEVLAAPQWPRARREDYSFVNQARFRARFVSDIIEVGPFAGPLLLARSADPSGLMTGRPWTASQTQQRGGELVRSRGLIWAEGVLASLGFGRRPGVGLADEAQGWLNGSPYDRVNAERRLGRGERTGATLLQLAMSYGALLTRQRTLRPRVVLDPAPVDIPPSGHVAGTTPTSLENVDRSEAVLRTWAATTTDDAPNDVVFVQAEALRRFDDSGLTSVVGLAATDRQGVRVLVAVHVESPQPAASLRSAVRRATLDALAEVP